MPSIEKKESGLKKSLGLIFVYTVATGSIFTYVSYWDSVFFSYCGAGTFLAFALMTLAILPLRWCTASFLRCSTPPAAN